MKKSKILFLTLIFLCPFLSLFAKESHCSCLSNIEYPCFNFQKGDNIYVNEEYLFFDNGKIYLDVAGNPMEIHNLSSDSDGVYISATKESEQGWTCPICYTYNPPGRLICINFYRHYDFD